MAYMDNPQTLSKRARRVIPAYADLVSDYLGMAQIVVAFLIAVTSVVGFVIKSFTSAAASGILLSLPLLACGVLGVLAGVRKETWAILGYLLFSIISLILCVVLLGAAVVGIATEFERERSVSVSVREGVNIALVAFSLLAGASVTFSAVLSGTHIVKGCCSCVKGAKYVEEPSVAFSNPASEEIRQSSEHAGYDQPGQTDTTVHISTVAEIPGPQPNQNLKINNGHFNNPLANSSVS